MAFGRKGCPWSLRDRINRFQLFQAVNLSRCKILGKPVEEGEPDLIAEMACRYISLLERDLISLGKEGRTSI